MSSASPSGSTMRRHIRAQTIKMAIVILGIAGVTVFAWDFVYTGLKAKLVLNGGIWLVFLFGVLMSFLTIMRLRNEEIAFAALVEAFDDLKESRTRGASDPYWRHYRCLTPGIVFQRPRLLGHVFEIVYEEMQRSKKLSISVGTLQSLVHGVEEKLAEERSLVSYLSGLLVFLGLIGAFIGLIQMVQSVGGIVGSLGGASAPGADTSAMFGQLIGELQGPLKGMSVGFSSSLFGLAGSLTLGLIGRFAAQAGTALKAEFESWLANVAQIEQGEGEAAIAVVGTDPRVAEGMMQAVGGMNRAVTQSSQSIDKMAELVERVAALQAEQAAALAKTSEALERLVAGQDDLRVHMARSAAHTSTLAVAKDEMLTLGRGLEREMTTGFARMGDAIDRLGRVSAPTDVRPIEIAIREAFDGGFTRLSEALDRQSQDLGQLVRSVPAAEGAQPTLDALAEVRRRTDALEGAIAGGLTDVARALETNFRAYAQLVSEADRRSGEHAAPVADGSQSAGVVPDPEPADPEAMMRRLYDRIAEQYRTAAKS